jgi:hypothetical protein
VTTTPAAAATRGRRPAVHHVILGLLALGGVWLRLAPLVAGHWRFPVDYDEGVYFGAASLLARGVLPYRDFVFVHPPGWLLLLFPVAGPLSGIIGVDHAFEAARLAVAFLGGANIVLVGLVGTRIRGPVAGCVAAALYATHPDVVAVERGVFLEPALNLFVLGAAWCWLGEVRRRGVAAGVLLGAACLVKTWGAFSVVAAVAAAPATGLAVFRRSLSRLAIGGAVVAVVTLAVLVAVAPGHFFDQVVRFQLTRAPDGAPPGLTRLRVMFEPLTIRNRPQLLAAIHPVSSVGAAIGAVWALTRAWRRDARAERYLLVLAAVTVAAFLVGVTFWTQYDSHLAVPETLLAGYAAGAAWELLQRAPLRPLRAVLLVALALTPILPARQAITAGRPRTDDLVQLATFLREDVPAGTCLFAFEPAWGLAAGRLPPHGQGRPVIADPYAAMLLPTTRTGASYESIGPAFETPPSQVEIRRLLDRCEWVVYGGRGPAQLSAKSEAWFQQHFTRRYPAASLPGIDVWQRTG